MQSEQPNILPHPNYDYNFFCLHRYRYGNFSLDQIFIIHETFEKKLVFMKSSKWLRILYSNAKKKHCKQEFLLGIIPNNVESTARVPTLLSSTVTFHIFHHRFCCCCFFYSIEISVALCRFRNFIISINVNFNISIFAFATWCWWWCECDRCEMFNM